MLGTAPNRELDDALAPAAGAAPPKTDCPPAEAALVELPNTDPPPVDVLPAAKLKAGGGAASGALETAVLLAALVPKLKLGLAGAGAPPPPPNWNTAAAVVVAAVAAAFVEGPN